MLPFLEEKKILPGVRAELVEMLPLNQTMSLKLEQGQVVTLGLNVAHYIFGERI